MRLTLADVRSRLRSSGAAVVALAEHADATQARWKPAPDRWSLLEVVCHLADEEVEDFRQRLGLVLSDPAAPWPPIDPPRAVIERAYNERDLTESLRRFRRERQKSLEWLGRLSEPDWGATHHHPTMGPMTAARLAASWVAHDLLHIRQITKLHYDWVVAEAKPEEVSYAGKWV